MLSDLTSSKETLLNKFSEKAVAKSVGKRQYYVKVLFCC